MATAILRIETPGVDAAHRNLTDLNKAVKDLGSSGSEASRGTGDLSGKIKDVASASNDAERATAALTLGKAALAAGAVAAGAAIGAMVVSTYNAVKGLTDLGGKVYDLSQRTGQTAEEISGLTLAFKTNGLSLDEGSRAFERFNRNMYQANQGSSQQQRVFEALGVSVKDAAGNVRDSGEVFNEVADKFAQMENGAGKTALAMALFGRSGAALIPLLNEGAAGLTKLKEEAAKAGLVISTETAKAADDLGDAIDVLKGHMDGILQQRATPFVKFFAEVAGGMREAAKDGGILSTVLRGLQDSFRLMVFGSEQSQLGAKQAEFAALTKKIAELESKRTGSNATAFDTVINGRIDASIKRLEEERSKIEYDIKRLEAFVSPTGTTRNPLSKAPDLPDKPKKERSERVDRVKDEEQQIFNEVEGFTKRRIALGQAELEDLLAFYAERAEYVAGNYRKEQDLALKMDEVKKQIAEREAKRSKDAADDIQREFKLMGDVAAAEKRYYEESIRKLKEKQNAQVSIATEEIKLAQEGIYWTREGKIKALEDLKQKYIEMGVMGVEAVKKIDKAMAEEMNKTTGNATDMARRIRSVFGELSFDIVSIFSSVHRGLQSNIADVLKGHKSVAEGIKGIYRSLGDAIINEFARIAANQMMSMVLPFLGMGGGGGAVMGAGGAANALGSIGSVANLVGGGFGNLASSVTGFVGSGFQELGVSLGSQGIADIGNILNAFSAGGFGEGMGAISSIFGGGFSFTGEPISTALLTLLSMSGMGGGIMESLGGAFNGIVSGVGGFIGDIVGGIGDLFGGLFATGTDQLVTSPTMVMVGENGPERLRVDPVSGAGGMRGGGPTVVFQGPVIMDEYSTRLWQRGQQRGMRGL